MKKEKDFFGTLFGILDNVFTIYLAYLIIKYLFIEPDVMYFLLSTIACAVWQLSCIVCATCRLKCKE